VIVAVPAADPVTSPLALTVATPAALVPHAIVRPVSTFPLASFRLAVSCTVAPTGTLADAGLTTTDATGAGGGGGSDVTVTVAVPLFPSLVAVIVAVPAATPVTSPLPLTVATPDVPLAQLTVRPFSTFPLASFSVALSCTDCPTVRLADAGLTVTVATGAGGGGGGGGSVVTVTEAVPLFPSLVAVIVAAPAATAVTSPLGDAAAMAGLLDIQATARPLSGLPAESLVAAASCTVPPTCTLIVAGLTATDATGAGITLIMAVSAIPPGRPLTTTLAAPASAPAW